MVKLHGAKPAALQLLGDTAEMSHPHVYCLMLVGQAALITLRPPTLFVVCCKEQIHIQLNASRSASQCCVSTCDELPDSPASIQPQLLKIAAALPTLSTLVPKCQ